ncbi:MAG TPA: hypothetical protein VJZ32_10090 [Candidatus Bathyarchaeia archaeon]|nr:hypothetical protein [Candidatus Bathyarchaeia archaeon]
MGDISSDVSLLSSIAIILGAIFVVVQIRQNNKLIGAASEQAHASAIQATLTTEQLKQNNEIANMDLIMRLYEFANSAEVQSAWLTVLNSNIASFEQFEELTKPEQVAFFQIAALFESLGVLVQREIIKPDLIDDMFEVPLAWRSLIPFVSGIRQKYGDSAGYSAFERLHDSLTQKS